jgi:hypothetical protein
MTARNGDFGVLDFTPLVELTPRIPKLLSSLGLIQNVVMGETTIAQVERVTEALDTIQARARGGDRNFAGRENAIVRNFNIPFFPLDSRFTANEIQDLREYGTSDTPTTVESRVLRSMQRVRNSHTNTYEKALYAALKGSSFSPSYTQGQYSYFTEFGVSQKTFPIDFTNDAIDPRITVEKQARKHIIDNAKDNGDSYKVIAIVGSGFFNSLITHPLVQAAYDSYPSESEPLRKRLGGDLINRSFDTSGVTYIEDISGEIADGDGYFLPLGISTMFQAQYAPADSVLWANTPAQEMYVFLDESNHRVSKVETESSFIVVNTRPELVPKATGNTLRA